MEIRNNEKSLLGSRIKFIMGRNCKYLRNILDSNLSFEIHADNINGMTVEKKSFVRQTMKCYFKVRRKLPFKTNIVGAFE